MNIPARRSVLANITLEKRRFPHTGLWLDKFLEEQTEQSGENTYTAHFENAMAIPIAPAYEHFFKHWEGTLKAAGTRTATAKTLGRLVVGLGAESVLENAITLHRTYGVPVIPGSALKGLAAAYARNRLEHGDWRKDGEAYKTLFGDTSSAGYVTFFDALYVPGSAKNDKPLALDVVTVHHPDYYRGEDSPPADWDGPNPVPFVSIRGDVKFLVALDGPENWVEAAFQILGKALAEEGIGAKTNSGYGRMALDYLSQEEKADAVDSAPEVRQFGERLQGMRNVAGEIFNVYEDWQRLEASIDVKRRIAQMILEKVEAAKLPQKWKKQAKERPEKARRNFEWYETLVAYVNQGDGG